MKKLLMINNLNEKYHRNNKHQQSRFGHTWFVFLHCRYTPKTSNI